MSSLLNPEDGLTFICHLLGLFMILQSKLEQKEIQAPKTECEGDGERERKLKSFVCQQTAGEKKNVASPETVFVLLFRS